MKINLVMQLFIVSFIGIGLMMTTAGCGNDNSDHEEHGNSDENDREHKEEENEHGASELSLTDNQIKLAEIETSVVSRGEIFIELSLPGEVVLNQDRLTHIVPRVSGIVQEVNKVLGDKVHAGEVLAVLDSRELADAEAEFLASLQRHELALTNFKREESLRKKEISSEQEYLEAKQALAEVRIEMASAEKKLHALGFSEDYLKTLPDQSETVLARYEISSPLNGTIIEKHIVLGEQLTNDTNIYAIADLNSVWVMCSVYEKDIARISNGQIAELKVKAYPDRSFTGKVAWIADLLDEDTRTMQIRVEVDNKDHMLKPGMFTRVALVVKKKQNVLSIPQSAIQTQKGEAIVFIDEGRGRFERREVEIGIKSTTAIEIVSGIQEGEKVVTRGSFILKSELEKAGFGGGHGH